MGLTKQQQARLKAFGDGISYSEGTKGYNTYFGGGSFDNSKPHPGKPLRSSSGGQSSSAAGRYQFMDFTWKDIWKGQNPPMTEENQEKAFVILLKRRGAYDDVLSGNFEQAYKKVSNEWASVKGNSYTFNGKAQGKHEPSALASYTQKKYKEYSSPPPAGGILSSPVQREQSSGLFSGKAGLTY
jgi:muramidase (phage lysozyme)